MTVALLAASMMAARADDFDDEFAPPSRGGARGHTAGAKDSAGTPRDQGDRSAAGDASPGRSEGAVATARQADRPGVEEVSFVLEHSLHFNPGDAADPAAKFAPCGVFGAKAHRASSGNAVRLSHLRLTRDPVDEEFAAGFGRLVEDDLHYRVRVPANVLHPRAGEFVMAFLPARCLAEAGLQENFVLHMDEAGNVVGMDYGTAGGECHADAVPTPLGPNPAFRTTAAVRFYKVGW